jgi:drug/metabolite transporter (DMT)-like permease
MPISSLTHRPDLLPSLAILLGGALWGLFWVPVRALGDLGLGGAWPAAMIFGGCLCLLLPVLPFRVHHLARSWRAVAPGGLFTGMALAFYSISLLMTDVVHSLLLFYLTPVWSTALGIALLGEHLTLSRVGALALGGAGLVVVLGGGEGMPWPRNLGDWLALAAGMAWAYGSLRLYRVGTVAVPEQILTFTVGSLAVIFIAIAVGGPPFGGVPSAETLRSAAPWGLLVALIVLPTVFLTLWPAMLLSPGRVGILLLSEVVVGVASAAAFTGEPFGFREALGTGLIVGAGGLEVLGRREGEAKASLMPRSGTPR